MLLLRFFNKFFPEIRVGNGNQLLRPLPGVHAGQVHRAVLSDDVMALTAGGGDDVAALTSSALSIENNGFLITFFCISIIETTLFAFCIS